MFSVYTWTKSPKPGAVAVVLGRSNRIPTRWDAMRLAQSDWLASDHNEDGR